MDFVGPVIEILPRLWDCTSNRIAMIRHLQENLTSLRQTRHELENISKDVRIRVELAEQQFRKCSNQVEGWLESVQLKLEEVQNILQKGEREIQKKCLGSCCPRNCYSSYKLGKEVIKGTEAVKDLVNKGKKFKSLDDISEKLPPAPVDEIPVAKTMGMASILDEVWGCLDDDRVRTIGIYGIGGVGKTTLLKKLNNKFVDNRLDFDVVIWVTVSKEANLDGIQEVIRNKLDIPEELWKSKIDEHGRAIEIYRSLCGKRFVLLLDDLWERIDLTDMGVPDLSWRPNGSKIVFTTRSEEVCHKMDPAVKKFKVKCLSPKESFELFRQCVTEDVLDSHHQITEFAETIAEECNGLPLALITVGRAMSNRRTPDEWRYAIKKLQSDPSDFPDMESRVFQVLRFSYDSLRNDKQKNCFLYCSLFPKDHMIRKDELIDLWIAEGILHNYGLEGILHDYGLNDARDEGQFILRSLKHACLLEKVGDSDDYVKMHDVLRDMALSLALEKESKISVNENPEVIKKPGLAKWEEAVRISLWGGSIKSFREIPFCPGLLTFLVKQTEIKTFPSSFFQSMHDMNVLDLSNNLFLKTLPGMSELTNMQYLNLSNTDIQELPIMANNLTKLRFLLLDGTRELKAISEGVISSLSSLQVFSRVPTKNSPLYFHSFWNTTLLQELKCLEDIEEISVTLFTVDAVFQLKSSPKLQSCVKRLVILCEQGKELHSPNTSSSVLSSGCFGNLHDVYIKNCLIKDLTCLRYATRIRFVFAENCPLLVEIIANDFSSPNMFKNLKQLNFRYLPLLKSICRVMHFPSLERIWVVGCPSLTKLPLDLLSKNNSRITVLGDDKWWNELEWGDSSSKVSYPSMYQTAPVSGLTAQSCSYNFPHFTVADWYSDVPSYTYEATRFEKKRNAMDAILDDVWKCLDDRTVRMIGIYGLGGVGKTTILKKLNSKFIDKRLDFDVVIWVTVGNEVDLDGIQEVIRHRLQIPDETWKTKTDKHGRATEICRSLSGKRFVLLLDDLWERIDLQNVGVPDLSYNENRSKIVLTTRSKSVCHSMDTTVKIFEVTCLSSEESFELFRQCVKEDVLNSHPEIPELAKTVAKECGGLPLALITIGRAMSNKIKPEEWRYAIDTLQSQRSQFADVGSSIFQVLKFVYDSLRDDKHKKCFLYCSMFPEDHMIRKDELIEHWIAEGILPDHGLEDARYSGECIIGSLKNACLLETVADSDDYVKMHDVLRDMALWLAYIEGNKIFVFEDLKSIKTHGIFRWKEAVRMSLWGERIKLFHESPCCPRLLTFLARQTAVETFPSSFFQSMHAMKVLNLSRNHCLTRLPAMLEMTNLQYLNLSDTQIQELPIVASSLTKLRFLLLDGTTKLEAISEGVISSLSLLQVFSRVPINERLDFHSFWNTTLLRELECLENIEEISVTLFTINAVIQLKSSPKLQNRVKRLVILCEQGEELHSPNTSSSVLSSGRFDNLHDLYIKNCLIKDLTCLRYATRLRFVFADECPLLEEIIAYEFSSSSENPTMFKNLKHLNFRDLPLLKSICRVMHFPSLERICVVRCPNLTKLPLDPVSENNSRISIFGRQEWWDKLEWENSSSKVSYPSMHQTAPVSGLAAQSCSYIFPHFTVADWYSDVSSYTHEIAKFEKKRFSDEPSYTYEATKFEKQTARRVNKQ